MAGFRFSKSGKDAVGLTHLAGRVLQHVGATSSFTMATRKALVQELAPLRSCSLAHPWRGWAEMDAATLSRMPGAQSRWSVAKDLCGGEQPPLERVCEVKYDHLQGNRFRHAAVFLDMVHKPYRAIADMIRSAGHGFPGVPVFHPGPGAPEGPQVRRHVSEVHPDAGPRRESPSHRIHEHVGGLQMRCRLGVARLPALEGLERWKARHPQAAAHLEPADVLVDAMRGRFTTWTRVRVNLRNVPAELRPAQEPLDPDEKT